VRRETAEFWRDVVMEQRPSWSCRPTAQLRLVK
jgi:hypothetical protein